MNKSYYAFALAGLLAVAPSCAGAPEGDAAAAPNGAEGEAAGERELAVTSAATPEERGVGSLGDGLGPLWRRGFNNLVWTDGPVGAFRGWARNAPDSTYRYWTGDNALMLWAFSKGPYAQGRQEWGVPIRDYLVAAAYASGNNGFFNEGVRWDGAQGLAWAPVQCSPYSETQTLYGLIEFTRNYPNQAGKYAADHYRNFVDNFVAKQHALVRARNTQNSDPACTGTNHAFGDPMNMSFHVLNLVRWAAVRNDPKYSQWASEAWGWLRPMQLSSGLFVVRYVNGHPRANSLRNAQILFALTELMRAGAALPGLADARDRLARASRQDDAGRLYWLTGDPVSDAPENRETDTAILSLVHYLSAVPAPGQTNGRPRAVSMFFSLRDCSNGVGYRWRGFAEQAPPQLAPIEGQAGGLLGSWYALYRQTWNEAGATCSLIR
jgi:hypothetical protein